MERKCNPIENGYSCILSLNDLNEFKNRYNLRHVSVNEGMRKRTELYNSKNEIVANAFKYNNSESIYLISKKPYRP